jgi:hypothetical protein
MMVESLFNMIFIKIYVECKISSIAADPYMVPYQIKR